MYTLSFNIFTICIIHSVKTLLIQSRERIEKMSKTVISIKYEGQYSGYLSMEETDGKGVLHLDSTLPDAPSTDTDNYCFDMEFTGTWGKAMGQDFKQFRFRSHAHDTKYITGYGMSYLVKGEPLILSQDGHPNAYSNWQVHSYGDVIGESGHENLVALYNSESSCYLVIKIKGNAHSPDHKFYLSNNIGEDVRHNGKFVIESIPS